MAGVKKWMIAAVAAGVMAIFSATVVLTAGPTLFSGAGSAPQCRASARIAAAVDPLATGEMAAFQTIRPRDLTGLPFDSVEGEARTIAALKGRVTLLNLWATWCAPCRAEMPMLAGLHEAMAGTDFAVTAVSIDTKERNDPESFLTESGGAALAYHREPTLTLFNALRDMDLAQGMPTTLLLGPDGCAAGVLHGIAEWDTPDAKRLIRAAIDAG